MRSLWAIPILIALAFLLIFSPAEAYAEEYDPSVFSPNGVLYKISFDALISMENETKGYYDYERTWGNGSLNIFSREEGTDYYAWSFSISFEAYYNCCRSGEEPRMETMQIPNVPVPPFIAVKKGTRETYFMIDLERLTKGMQEVSSPEEARALLTEAYGKVYEEIYFTNFFYIPVDVGIGSKIVYGIYNKTSGEKFEVALTISGEEAVGTPEGTFDAWVIALDSESLIELMGEMGIDSDAAEAIRAANPQINIYYDKASGWLLKYEASGSATNTTYVEHGEEVIEVSAEGSYYFLLELVQAGTVNVGGKSVLERTLHLPKEAIIAIGGAIFCISLLRVIPPTKR